MSIMPRSPKGYVPAERYNSRTIGSISSDGIAAECHVQRLTYLSMARDPEEWTPKFFAELEETTRQRNLAIGVSGFFLYTAPYFFEVIEGFPEVIGPLFQLIQRNPRYDKCIVLVDVRSSERLYPDWRLRGVSNDATRLPEMVPTILRQIASAFLSMWAFLPRNAADLVLQGKDPRTHLPESRDVVVLFLSLVEFSAIMAHPLLGEHLGDLFMAFVDICARNVHTTGGQVAKFVNGVCMAYWPASQAAGAYAGVTNIVSDFEALRERSPGGSAFRILHPRAGLHCGHALLCNAGNERADFTLLGDCVNVAARLPSVADALRCAVVVSSPVQALMGVAGRQLIDVGRQPLKGRVEAVQCYRAQGPPLDTADVRRLIDHFGQAGPAPPAVQPVRNLASVPSADRPPIFDSLLDVPEARPTGGLAKRWLRCLLPASCAPPEPDESPRGSSLLGLLYISHSSAPMTPADLAAIQKVGERRNRAAGITSELLYFDSLLVQSVEGPAHAVGDLWGRLERDGRHRELVVVHLATIKQRMHHSPLDVNRMGGDVLATLPVLPEVISQLARSFRSLETYLPQAVVRHILAGREPRLLRPVRVDIVMMAADIVCFTRLSEGCPLTEVWQMCTTFIDLCTSEIHQHSGEVIKLIGDCVVAYFPPAAAHAALQAAQDIIRVCRARRQRVHPLDCRSVMACGVGLDFGPVAMMHCGNQFLSKFIVTGSVKARVLEAEALTRVVGRKIIMTQPFVDLLPSNVPLDPVDAGGLAVPCFAYGGSDWHLDKNAIRTAIEAYHRACNTIRSTPLLGLLPQSDSVEQIPLPDMPGTPGIRARPAF